MIVVIAKYIPPAVRGRMKLWFIEPEPNIFVSGINDSLAENVTNYLLKHCPNKSQLLIFKSINLAPWFEIKQLGQCRNVTKIQGLQLIKKI